MFTFQLRRPEINVNKCIFTDISTQDKRAATCVQTSANPAIHVQWPESTFALFLTITHGQRGELFNGCE